MTGLLRWIHACIYHIVSFCSDSPWLSLSLSPGIWIRGRLRQVLWQMCSEEVCCYRARQQHTFDWGQHFKTFRNLCFMAHLVLSVMYVVLHVWPTFCFPAQVNETYIPPDDKCKKYICEENNGVLVTKESVTICPHFNPLDCEPVSVLNSYFRHPSAHIHTISHTTWHMSPSSRALRQLMQMDAANPVGQQSHANKNKKSYASCGIDHLFGTSPFLYVAGKVRNICKVQTEQLVISVRNCTSARSINSTYCAGHCGSSSKWVYLFSTRSK